MCHIYDCLCHMIVSLYLYDDFTGPRLRALYVADGELVRLGIRVRVPRQDAALAVHEHRVHGCGRVGQYRLPYRHVIIVINNIVVVVVVVGRVRVRSTNVADFGPTGRDDRGAGNGGVRAEVCDYGQAVVGRGECNGVGEAVSAVAEDHSTSAR